MVGEIRQVHRPGPFTLVFDRVGFSADAFRFLTTEGIGFITYLERPQTLPPRARRPLPRSWFAFEGSRQVYHVVEKTTRVGRAGTLRTILVLGDEDQQIPVLTNLTAAVKPAKGGGSPAGRQCTQARGRECRTARGPPLSADYQAPDDVLDPVTSEL